MKYVICGAGVAGLTVAYKLLEKGHEVAVLEKESDIGGFSRSFRYGNFIFDIGPHRFFSNKDEVFRFIIFVLNQDPVFIDRKSSIYLLNRYFSWPLRPCVLLKLPLPILLNIGRDAFLKPKFQGQDFRSSIISRYGRTLYELVFKDYTEKFCYVPGEELHRNWAKASLDKTIIDKRIKIDSLIDLAKVACKPISPGTKFLYPEGGCGRFAQNLGKMIIKKGGSIITDVNNISINVEGKRIDSLRYGAPAERTIEFDHFIYTAPLTQLAQYLNLGTPDLEYLNSIIYNIEIKRPLKNRNQWIYFGDSKVSFVRVSFPKNLHKDNIPPGKDSLCVEVTCKNNSILWENPDSIKGRLIKDLIKVRLCQQKDIDSIHIEKIAYTYPIYKLNYLEELEKTKRQLSGFSNLTCLGRTATFWYNNMDESIEAALEIADHIGARKK
jgi:protoporphyrinogen oxidase